MDAAASELDVIVEHPGPAPDVERLRAAALACLAAEAPGSYTVALILTDRETVWALNRTYLQHDYPTDVLSFDLSADEPGAPLEGEVYVDLDMAHERHAEFGADFATEACRYALHGLLHLVGYDDAAPEDKARMHALEDRYLGLAP